MRRSSGLAGGALLVALAAGFCTTILAYFTATGTGNASANVTQLPAPSISSVTPAIGGTVALSWSAVTPPGPGPVTYAVIRDGDEPAGDCPSATPPSTTTSCTDAELAVGTHTDMVRAKWRSWTATSSPATAKVTVGAATHFGLSAASTTPAAGTADNLTIAALDVHGSTVTTYAGSRNLTFSGASSSTGGTAPTVSKASGSATSINFSAGVATVASAKNGVMKLYSAEATKISVSDGSIASEPALALTVSPTTASKLLLSPTSTTPVAGSSDDLTTTAQDTYGNTATHLHRLAQPDLLRCFGWPRGRWSDRYQQRRRRHPLRHCHVDHLQRRSCQCLQLDKRLHEALQERLQQHQSQRRLDFELGDDGGRERGGGHRAVVDGSLDDADRGSVRQPHRHRARRLRQHGHKLHRQPQPHLLRRGHEHKRIRTYGGKQLGRSHGLW